MYQSKVSSLRALWVLRVSSVCVGIVLLYALISKGTRQPPAGEDFGRGMPFGVDDDLDTLKRMPELHRDEELAAERQGLVESNELAADLDIDEDDDEDSENVAMEQEADRETVFSLARMARLLGWGRDQDEEEEAGLVSDDGDRIGDVILGDTPDAVLDGPPRDGDWMNSPLLRNFLARFDHPTATPEPDLDEPGTEDDDLPEPGPGALEPPVDLDAVGEMQDFSPQFPPQQLSDAAR